MTHLHAGIGTAGQQSETMALRKAREPGCKRGGATRARALELDQKSEMRRVDNPCKARVRRWKALDLRSLNMQFQQDWPKDEKITALLNFC